MDFCKESDYYISLYIDEMLDQTTKTEFEKHIKECGRCAQKLEEATALTELCRESEDIMLPQNFSSSLHERLIKVAEKERKGWPFIYNRKLIAGLSTAAVLVVSLLAYSLLPDTNQSRQSASISTDTAVQRSITGSAESTNSAKMETEQTDDAKQSAPNENAQVSKEVGSGSGSNRNDNGDLDSKKYSDKKTTGNTTPKIGGGAASPSEKTNKENSSASIYSMKIAQDTDLQQYFSNTAELNLKVSGESNEKSDEEALRELMSEFGASEIKSDAKIASITAEPYYVDYVLSIDSFGKLKQEAADKYNLQLSIMVPVTKDDVTEEYNDLERQKNELDKKIDDMTKKGEDTSSLKEEINNLTQKMDDIVKNNGMITVRIFFVDK